MIGAQADARPDRARRSLEAINTCALKKSDYGGVLN